MKITYEFDTNSEGFSYHEYEEFKQGPDAVHCLVGILDQLRDLEKWDERVTISKYEIVDQLRSYIVEHVDLDKMGY